MKSNEWCINFRIVAAKRVKDVVKQMSSKTKTLDPKAHFRSYQCATDDSKLEFLCKIQQEEPRVLSWTENQAVIKNATFSAYQTIHYPDLILLHAYFFNLDEDKSILYMICSNKFDNEIEIRVHEGRGIIFSLRFNQIDIPFFDGFMGLLFPEIPHILRICLDTTNQMDEYSVENFSYRDDGIGDRLKQRIWAAPFQRGADFLRWFTSSFWCERKDIKASMLCSKICFYDWARTMTLLQEDAPIINFRAKDLTPPEEFINSASPKMSVALAKFLILVSEAYVKYDMTGIGAPTEWTNSHWLMIYSYLVDSFLNPLRCRSASNIGIKFFKEPVFCCICQQHFDKDVKMMISPCNHIMCTECFEAWVIRTIDLDLKGAAASKIDNCKCPICRRGAFSYRTIHFRSSLKVSALETK